MALCYLCGCCAVGVTSFPKSCILQCVTWTLCVSLNVRTLLPQLVLTVLCADVLSTHSGKASRAYFAMHNCPTTILDFSSTTNAMVHTMCIQDACLVGARAHAEKCTPDKQMTGITYGMEDASCRQRVCTFLYSSKLLVLTMYTTIKSVPIRLSTMMTIHEHWYHCIMINLVTSIEASLYTVLHPWASVCTSA